MRQLKLGTMLCLSLASVLLSSCRNSNPPPIDICIGDGFGGADCVLKDNTKAYLSPSQLKNYWMTPEADEAAFSSWCYDASQSNVKAQMKAIKRATK